MNQEQNNQKNTSKTSFCGKCLLDTIDCDCNHDYTKAVVFEIPTCNFCAKPAKYDAATSLKNMWAFMCQAHYTEFGLHAELGLGKGQLLIKAGK